ncbi:uncharacterized protein LOC129907858 [Episyrphus balteatus]|uniref:uncharacterized protein LOC129907858 n=1 Tax=Episyrphus balteatus TaxID=286459 RepID=UPI0024859AB2|nr:uncharacterized protein LOC129907858 [Episyrphus balteatus]
MLRQQYWILGSRNLIRKIVFSCKTCFMQSRLRSNQLMGDLPVERIQPTGPFTNSGLDYAGPFTIKFSSGRNPKLTKTYVALFLCFSTKAVYLEAVSDLTTDAFLAALRRFVSRRGRCANLYSDNGTNFQGARRCLTEMHKLVMSQQHNSIISTSLAREGINWHFIPPSAPHFGGLWEAGVKSMKFHLRRVVGSSLLTFEELSTVLSQIEAILNSRPLCSISDNDLNPLTPSHYLIGEPLTSIPEPIVEDIPQNRLTHWNLMQKMVQGFWRRWHMGYLTTLQDRKKTWDLVVIKEPNVPATKWVLARVEDVTPGADGIVRDATIRTANGTFVRPITKLALLPAN